MPLIETWAMDNSVQIKQVTRTNTIVHWTDAEDKVISNGRNDSPPPSHSVIAGLLTNRSERQVRNRWDILKRN